MGTLGDFLGAVYGPADRFRTVRAVVRQREDRDAAERALAVMVRFTQPTPSSPH